jgi:hypothetical protein
MRRPALLLICCACLGAQTAAVEGLVVNKATGEPMAGVHVRFNNTSSSGDGQPYGAVSDRAGHFSVASLPAGTYLVEGKQRGYFHMPPTGGVTAPRVSLKAGQHVTDYRVEMAQGATISGHVLDENGDPVQTGFDAEPESGRAMNGGRWGNTDERGMFHVTVAPGKYYIVVNPGNSGMNQPPEIHTDGSVEALYGTTFYPGSATKAKAVLVEAAAGAELTGIDIHMARQPRGLSISGTVSGATEGPGGSMVMLQQGDDPWHIDTAGATGVGPDGHFRLTNLQPGTYRLCAFYAFSETRLYSLPVDLRLEGDVTGVNLVLAPGGEMTGKLEMAGDPWPEKLTVSLEPAQNGSMIMEESALSADVDAAGAFRIGGIGPGRYRVKVLPLPENAYLKSVRLDDADAPDGKLDLSHGAQGSSVRIVASRNGGQVSGKLLDKSGELVGPLPAMVLLVADPKEFDLDRSSKMIEDGTYSFQGIRPGKYRLVAFDRLLLELDPDSRETIKKLAAAAEEIEIKEGDRRVKDLKLMVKEDASAKPRQ